MADRREEIPGHVLAFARRFSEEAGCESPEFEDDALALLWRQPWESNLRALANLVYEIVVLAPGQALDAPAVQRIAARFGQSLLRRLPSRHPRRSDLRAALETTRNAVGTINKTRAALYLGWDPDTLVARLREAHLCEVPPEA
jgi:DNA-binding NtrC family response regulator